MYQISKGWPSDAAIDEVFKAASGNKLHEGMVVQLNANHEGVGITSYDPAAGSVVFVIGHEHLNKTFTGLMHPCVISCDKDCFVSTDDFTGYVGYVTVGSETVQDDDGNDVVLKGKFTKTGATANNAVGRVLAYDAATGILRIHWFESK